MATARYDDECDPSRCPCDDASCSLSKYVRAAREAQSPGGLTLEATEQAVADRLQGMDIDMTAMAVVANVYRAANATRNHLERTVLAPHGLTWTGWVVLWVVWVWGEVESRHVAAAAGLSKGTLTGVQNTLLGKGHLQRRVHPSDARRVLLSLTDDGQRLMEQLFPEFNGAEAWLTTGMGEQEQRDVARGLRTLVKRTEQA